MTPPGVLSSEDQSVYKGRYAATLLEEHEVTFPSGCQVSASLYRVIDASTNPELLASLAEGSLNQVVCPGTGERMIADVPVVVHDPEFRLMFLVLPSIERSQQIRWRMELLAQLDEEGEELPPYVLSFKVEHLPFGPDQLERYRESVRLTRDLQEQARHLSAVAEAQAQEEQRLRRWAAELAGVQRRLRGGPDFPAEIDLSEGGTESLEADALLSGGAGAGPQGVLEDETPTVRARSPYYQESEEILELSSDEIELLEETEADRAGPSGADLEPVDPGIRAARSRTALRGEFASVHDTLKEIRPLALEQESPVDLAQVPLGRGVPFLGSDEQVALHFVVDHGRAKVFLQRDPDILLQLHRLPGYPIVSMLLVAQDAAGALLDELVCVFDIVNSRDRSILDRLLRDFRLEVHLYDEGGNRIQYLIYQKPLEKNLAYILDRAAHWLAQLGETARDFEKSVEQFTSDGFERIGAQKHGFHPASFAEITSATAARLAVSIVSYWSEEQNFEYLIENRSFPLETSRLIQRRVIEGALRFGVFLPFELRARTIEIGLAEGHAALLEQLVRRFTELMERGRSTDLDSVAQSENWEQLLTACADLGLAISEHSRELAEKARRRSRQLRSSPGISLMELQETDEYQRISSITQAPDEDLRELLKKGAMTPMVSRELLSRGGETNVLSVIESARFFDEEALEATARILSAGAEQFEPALLMGLGRDHPRTVHLCALALALAKRVEALPTLLERMHQPRLSGEIPLKEIVARYGTQAIRPVFLAIEERGLTDPLVEVLALISVEQGTEIIAALRENPSPPLLEAAQKMTIVRRRLRERVIRSLAEEEGEPPPDDVDEEPPEEDT